MSFPAQTTGLGVAAKIAVAGNETPISTKPGYNQVTLSLSGAHGFPETFQLNPIIEDASGSPITPGTVFTLTAAGTAAAFSTLTLTAVATSSAGTAVYTGTITGGASNALAGRSYTVAGFVATATNNGTFIATASSATTLTLENAQAVAETHAATATDTELVTIYTGTITGGATNAFAGKTFVVAGFVTAANNGDFIAVASSATTLTLSNTAGVAETHAGTATSEEVGSNVLTYFADGTASLLSGTGGQLPASAATKVVTVSATGLLTAVTPGGSTVEVSYPSFNNTEGTITVAGKALPKDKIYVDVAVNVVQ